MAPRFSVRRLAGLARRANLSVIVALVVGLGLLAYVSYLASVRSASGELWTIVGRSWLVVLLLTFPYLAARALVWYELLNQLQVRVPWRQLMVAFAAGEITKSLPAGVYVQNVLLQRLRHLGQEKSIRSITATTAMLGLESALAVPAALIIGIPGQPWVRLTILAIVAVWVVILFVMAALVRYRAHRIGPGTAMWRRRIVRVAVQFLIAARDLVTPRTLKELLPTTIYMLIYATDLYIVVRAAGIHSVGLGDVIGVYALVVLAVVMIPIPTEIGITEFAGLGGLLAYGISRPTAALIMLSVRLLASGSTIAVAAAILVLMRQELSSQETKLGSGAHAGP
jgi:uncharacterized membrane protein YbhN (UPF0104 family)